MPRFTLEKDIAFFRNISRELVDSVIETSVVLYKLVIENSKVNIYGESLSKTYYTPVQTTCIIERQDTGVTYEGFGNDSNQSVEFRFNKFTLEEVGFYPEIGDLIYHNNAYFEIDNVRDVDQLIGGQDYNDYSIMVNTFMTKRSGIQVEERVI
jgi:hypothetical protein